MFVALASTVSVVSTDAGAASGPDAGRLFRITKAGVPDSFVLGTIHIADPRLTTPAKPVLDALARCRTLAVELVAEAGTDLQEFEQLAGDRQLDRLIGPDAWARLRTRLGDRVPPDAIIRLKPWAALLRVSNASASAPASAPSVRSSPSATGASPASATSASLDVQLLIDARRRRMKILPLELLEEQIAAFDTIPEATQVALLDHALDHPAALQAAARDTVDAWLRGDLDALATIAAGRPDRFPAMRPHYGPLIAHLIEGRTALMHHRLFIPLREGRVFIAIGAMHLHGPKGLLALVREDGYRVSRVW